MALTGTDRGTATDNTAAALNFSPASNFTAGSLAVLCLAVDNNGASGASPTISVSDNTSGSTWVQRQVGLYDPGAAAAGVTIAIFTCQLTGNLGLASTINVTLTPTTTAKTATLMEVTAGVGSTATYVNSGVNTGAASATPTVTTSSITSGNMVIGWGGSESSNTWAGDADATNGSWSTQQTTVAGSGLTGMAITSQRKIVTATATQTYNPTLTSADVILGWMQLTETLTPTVTTRRMALLGVG